MKAVTWSSFLLGLVKCCIKRNNYCERSDDREWKPLSRHEKNELDRLFFTWIPMKNQSYHNVYNIINKVFTKRMKKGRNVNPVQEHHSCHNYTAASGFGNDCENGRENMRIMQNGSFMMTVSWYILLFKCKNHIFSSCIPILLHL